MTFSPPSPVSSSPVSPSPLAPSDRCLNCGAAAGGRFCPACGQETRLHVPSAAEFLHEFVGHYVALEGKLWTSLLLLLFKPGQLTAAYLAGRRVRYVQPLRLYLTLSLLFFALFKYGGLPLANFNADQAGAAPAVQVSAHPPARTPVPAPSPALAGDGGGIEQALRGATPRWAAKIEQFDALTAEGKSEAFAAAFFNYAPFAMFCLMPVFALHLKLLYLGSGRRYGEHLLFALHSNGFAFVMFALIAVSPWEPLKPLLLLWLVLYLPFALRRVYGGGRAGTLLRSAALLLLHLFGMGLAVVVAFGLAMIG